MKKISYLLMSAALSGFLVNAAPTWAEETKYKPFNFTGRYEFSWNGVPVGYLSMSTQESADKYSMKNVIRASGLAQVVSKHKSNTTVEGATEFSGLHHPITYTTNFETRGKGRDIKLGFNKAGTIISESNVPPENREKRPEVPTKDKVDAVDPLTAAFEARRFVQQWRGGNKETAFKLRMYDGRRAMWLTFNIIGKETIRVDGDEHPSIHINGRREAISGFTDNERKRIPNEEPEVDLYISDDDRAIPLYLKAKAIVGTVYASLKRECKTIEECSKK